jgi:predicted Zn-dependent protease with MMP-like domain
MLPVDPPSLDELAKIAQAALADIPAEFKQSIEDVVLRMEERPDDETLRSLRIANPLSLLGLYRGVPVGRKQTTTVAQNVDVIFLYRQPLLTFWRMTREPLADLVRHVLIHEIGHHFGLSDDDMAQIERGSE